MKKGSEWGVILSVAVAVVYSGCGRDARLVGRKLRMPVMRPVSYAGVELGPSASPRQVAWAMLKAIHDDVQARDASSREAAQDVQFDLCAAPVLVSRAVGGVNPAEWLYRFVSTWAPMLARYVDNFSGPADTPPEELEVVAESSFKNADACEVRMPLTDPEDPRGSVYLRVQLAHVDREDVPSAAPNGKLWRVSGLYFETWERPPARSTPK